MRGVSQDLRKRVTDDVDGEGRRLAASVSQIDCIRTRDEQEMRSEEEADARTAKVFDHFPFVLGSTREPSYTPESLPASAL